MSRETLEWLDNNVLVGCTEKRGLAWHQRKGAANAYPGFIPVADVISRLFAWEPVVTVRTCPCGCPNVDKDVSRSDNRHRMGIFKEGYEPHGYTETLVQTTNAILGGDIGIGSAGLLKLGAVAWVQAEVADNFTTPEGVTFRPQLLATTSLDGSVATTWKRTKTIVVCDNTRDQAMREDGQAYKIKHTRHSIARVADARTALMLIESIAEDVNDEIARQCAVPVSERQWSAFLDSLVPMPDEKGRGRTMAESKRDTLSRMYRFDARCAPWAGTQFGVLQTVDTWSQHEQGVRGVMRAERNMLNLVTGKASKESSDVEALLRKVLATV